MVPLKLVLSFKSRQRAALLEVCCLTFELRGRNRCGAWPARRMIRTSASRAKCHAGGGPWLERRVRALLSYTVRVAAFTWIGLVEGTEVPSRKCRTC